MILIFYQDLKAVIPLNILSDYYLLMIESKISPESFIGSNLIFPPQNLYLVNSNKRLCKNKMLMTIQRKAKMKLSIIRDLK